MLLILNAKKKKKEGKNEKKLVPKNLIIRMNGFICLT